MKILYILEFYLLTLNCCDSLHLKGRWNSKTFFKFLVKFGFQKTNINDKVNSLGYIYGNITSSINENHKAMLVVVDREYFLEFYGNRSFSDNISLRCDKMFAKIQTTAFDKNCNINGTQDFLRNIPCKNGQLCEDEDDPKRVVPYYQFTYDVQDTNQARFWYLALVACFQEGDGPTCNWKESPSLMIDYDIWLVNGNPYSSQQNIFKYQFSFDLRDTLEIYLVFFVLYAILVPLQFYAALLQHHAITRLFTVSVSLQLCYFLCYVIHSIKFCADGVGATTLATVGDIVYMLSESLLMLLLLLLAKGWAITRTELTWAPVLVILWVLYTCVEVLLYVWNMTEIDVIEDIDEYQTVPGWFTLLLRLVIMAWFLYELRSTMLDENDHAKLRFYLHFGAGILVWFVYLPLCAIIILCISDLWRSKLLLGMTSSADFMAFSILTHLLWPTRSEQYFQLASPIDIGEELEEFSEAPHNVQRVAKV